MTNSKSRVIRTEGTNDRKNCLPISQVIVVFNEEKGDSLVESVSVGLRLTQRDRFGIERNSRGIQRKRLRLHQEVAPPKE